MLNFEDYFQKDFGKVEIHHAIFLEELKELSLYISVEKPGKTKKHQSDLSKKLGLDVKIFALEDGSLEGLILAFEKELRQNGCHLPDDFSFHREGNQLFLASEDAAWLEEHFSDLTEFFSLWKKDLFLVAEVLAPPVRDYPLDDLEEDDYFHDSIDEELRRLVQENAQISPTRKTKRPHKYLQEIKGPLVKIRELLEEEQGGRVAIEGELLFYGEKRTEKW